MVINIGSMILSSLIGGTVGFFSGAIGAGLTAPLAEHLEQEVRKEWQTRLLTPYEYISLFRRRGMYSVNGKLVPPKDYAVLYDYLKRQGFSEYQIFNLLWATEAVPSPSDLVRFAVREVYTPEIIEKYGQMQELPPKFLEEAEKVGMSEEYAKAYWAAHWELPSASQGYEMLWRLSPDMVDFFRERIKSMGLDPEKVKFSLDDMRTLLRTLDVMPYWRDKLIAISYAPLTRVDLRRMWDVALISEKELYMRYRELGYSPKDAQLLTLFTKAYIIQRDLRAMYSKGWIDENGVRLKLKEIGIPEDRIDEWVKTIVKAEKEERVSKERELTKTEIIKGVKIGLITIDDGVKLLKGLGYDEWEAQYILAVNLVAMKGDPETPLELRRMVELRKKAMGLPYHEITDEMIALEKEIIELKKKIEELKKEGKVDEASQLAATLNDKEYRLRQLMIAHGIT